MLRFRGTSVLRRSPSETRDDLIVEIPDEQLGLSRHAINDSTTPRSHKRAEGSCPQPYALSASEASALRGEVNQVVIPAFIDPQPDVVAALQRLDFR